MSRLLHLKRTGKSTKARSKKKRDPLLIRPRYDWAILFITAVIINILVIAVHAFIFYRITNGSLFVGENAEVEEVRTVNRSSLSETLDYFRERESALIEAISTPPPTPDVR